MSAGFHRLGSNVEGKNLGYSAKTLPVLHAGIIYAKRIKPAAPAAASVPAPAKIDMAEFEPGQRKITRDEAKGKGYTGNSCSNCGSMEMQIAGHCEVCSSCGTTTGCS